MISKGPNSDFLNSPVLSYFYPGNTVATIIDSWLQFLQNQKPVVLVPAFIGLFIISHYVGFEDKYPADVPLSGFDAQGMPQQQQPQGVTGPHIANRPGEAYSSPLVSGRMQQQPGGGGDALGGGPAPAGGRGGPTYGQQQQPVQQPVMSQPPPPSSPSRPPPSVQENQDTTTNMTTTTAAATSAFTRPAPPPAPPAPDWSLTGLSKIRPPKQPLNKQGGPTVETQHFASPPPPPPPPPAIPPPSAERDRGSKSTRVQVRMVPRDSKENTRYETINIPTVSGQMPKNVTIQRRSNTEEIIMDKIERSSKRLGALRTTRNAGRLPYVPFTNLQFSLPRTLK